MVKRLTPSINNPFLAVLFDFIFIIQKDREYIAGVTWFVTNDTSVTRTKTTCIKNSARNKLSW